MKKISLLVTLIGVAVLLQGCLILTTAELAADAAIETVDLATDIIF